MAHWPPWLQVNNKGLGRDVLSASWLCWSTKASVWYKLWGLCWVEKQNNVYIVSLKYLQIADGGNFVWLWKWKMKIIKMLVPALNRIMFSLFPWQDYIYIIVVTFLQQTNKKKWKKYCRHYKETIKQSSLFVWSHDFSMIQYDYISMRTAVGCSTHDEKNNTAILISSEPNVVRTQECSRFIPNKRMCPYQTILFVLSGAWWCCWCW